MQYLHFFWDFIGVCALIINTVFIAHWICKEIVAAILQLIKKLKR